MCVEAIEDCFESHLLHMQQHLSHGGVGCLLNDALLVGKRLPISIHGRHIVLRTAVYMRVPVAMTMGVGMGIRNTVGMRLLFVRVHVIV